MFQSSRIGIASAGLVCGLLAQSAAAVSVTINPMAPYMWAGGGEFSVTPHDFVAPPVSLTNDGAFQTFCFQSQVQIHVGNTYMAQFDALLAPGGPALNSKTAYLYDSFIRGVLPGYEYTNATTHRTFDAGALQYAIWELSGQSTAGLTYNPDPAKTTFFEALANANSQPGNLYGVEVLVLYAGTANDPTYVQATLVKFLPAPGTASLLALAGVAAVRRRRSIEA